MPRGSKKGYVEDARTAKAFRALADSNRRKLIKLLIDEPGLNIAELCDHFSTSRFALMKHLNILEEAEMVTRERDGNTRLIYINPEPIERVLGHCEGWVKKLSKKPANKVRV